MKRHHWITWQKHDDKQRKSAWVLDVPAFKTRAKGLKVGDYIAVYVDKENGIKDGIKYIGEVKLRRDFIKDEWDKKRKKHWLKVAEMEWIAD